MLGLSKRRPTATNKELVSRAGGVLYIDARKADGLKEGSNDILTNPIQDLIDGNDLALNAFSGIETDGYAKDGTFFSNDYTGTNEIIIEGQGHGSADKFKIFGNSTQAIIPEQYQQVEYLESTGTQHIDTGIKLKTTNKLEISFERINDLEHFVFGSRISASSQGYTINLQPLMVGNNTHSCWSGGSTVDGLDKTYNKKVSLGNHIIKISSAGLLIDDVSYNCDIGTTDSTLNMYLFGLNQNGTLEARRKPMRIHYCKIWDNDTLIHNFIPCIRNSDNVAGMYDTVNQVFYTNAGTGTFILGPATPTVDTPSEIKSVGDKTANLFNKANAVNGFILTTNGTVAAASYNNKATDYILVTQDNVTISGHNYTQPNVSTVGLAWYDMNKVFISSVAFTSATGNGTYTKPANAVYCRYTVNTTDLNTSQFEVGTSATDYVPFGFKVEITSRGKNLTSDNIADWENGQYDVSGNKSIMLYRIRLKKLIKVKPSTIYYADTSKTLTPQLVTIIRTYDINGVFISSIGDITNKKNFTTPSNCYYISVTLGDYSGATYPSSSYFDWLTDKSLIPYIVENSMATKFEPYAPPSTTTYYLNEPLRAIEVASTYDYNVVANSKYYISDYIDKANNKVVRRVGTTVVDGTNLAFTVLTTDTAGYNRFRATSTLSASDTNVNTNKSMCNYATLIENGATYNRTNGFVVTGTSILLYNSDFATYTVEQINNWAKGLTAVGTPFTVAGLLTTPTEESIVDQVRLDVAKNYCDVDIISNLAPLRTDFKFFSDMPVMVFDGVDSYLSIDNSSNLNITGTQNFCISVVALIQRGAGTGYIVAKNDTGFADVRYGLAYEGGVLKVISSGVVILTSNPIQQERWYRISVIRDNGVLYLYVDGIIHAQIASVTSLVSSEKFRVGCRVQGTGNTLFCKMKLGALVIFAGPNATIKNCQKALNNISKAYL